jgi:hypothetical protein
VGFPAPYFRSTDDRGDAGSTGPKAHCRFLTQNKSNSVRHRTDYRVVDAHARFRNTIPPFAAVA